jgi:hypothetical protein
MGDPDVSPISSITATSAGNKMTMPASEIMISKILVAILESPV